jgi:competence protein ComEC
MVERYRHRLIRHFSATPDGSSHALLQALTVGDCRDLCHAMVHIQCNWHYAPHGDIRFAHQPGGRTGFLAGTVCMVTQRGIDRYLPATRAAALAAVAAALYYTRCPGLAYRRAGRWIMISILMLAIFLNRCSGFLQLFCLAAALTLCVRPVVHALGWMVAVLLGGVRDCLALVAAGRGRRGIRQWMSMLVSLEFGMLPWLLLMFQQASLVAPVANLWLPVVGMLVVPLALLGVLVFALHESAGGWLLYLAGRLLDGLWPILEWLGQLDIATWAVHRPAWWTLLPALAGLALLLAPRGVPGRWVGAALLLPMLLVRPERPERGAILVTLLDVGQGLSVIVQTADHVMVYDTGPGSVRSSIPGRRWWCHTCGNRYHPTGYAGGQSW